MTRRVQAKMLRCSHAEPFQRKETSKPKQAKKKQTKPRYQSDADYPFIEYAQRLPMPKVETTPLIDTTGFKLIVLPSQCK